MAVIGELIFGYRHGSDGVRRAHHILRQNGLGTLTLPVLVGHDQNRTEHVFRKENFIYSTNFMRLDEGSGNRKGC